MEQSMITLLNMTITAGFAAVFVIALRLLFKRLPKRFTCMLWLVVIFRFLCPVSFPSPYSILPVYSEPLEQGIVYEAIPSIESGVFFVDRPVNRMLEQTMAVKEPLVSVNPIQIMLFLMVIVWEAGMLVFFLYHFAGYIRLKRKLGTAVKAEDESHIGGKWLNCAVYESDRIPGAFILGIFRPVIYIPADLTKEERECVLRHERIHVRRGDYIVQLFGFLMVMVHWFNPLSHVSYRLLCQDLEMACDEAVVSELGEGGKKQYSLALLSAAEKSQGSCLPLAFGGSRTKSRIKNVLRYKKAGLLTLAAAVVLTGAAAAGLLTSREKPAKAAESVSIIGGQDGPTSIFAASKGSEEELERMTEMPPASWLSGQILEKGTEDTVSIAFASKDKVIFYGTCGLYSFMLEDGTWVPEMIIGPEASGDGNADEINEIVKEIKDRRETENYVGRTDAFVSRQSLNGSTVIDYDAVKLDDGSIAVLGGLGTMSQEGGAAGRLVDVFYGWYHPDEMVMHQVYLFSGDGKMVEGKEEIRERRYLFSTGGADYFLRTPETALDFEYRDGKLPESFLFPYGRQELIRKEGDKETEVLDPLVTDNQRFVLAEGRILYYGAASSDHISFKTPSLIGIRTDGSDRRVAEAAYQVYRGLCYDNGYLYFEGWANANEFPRPIFRMKPDFSEMTKIGEFNGSLITVKDKTFYMLSAEKPAIVLTREGSFNEVRYYDKCGYDAVNFECAGAAAADGTLQIRFSRITGEREYRDYEIPLAENGWWE